MSSQKPSGGIVTWNRDDNKTYGVAKTGGDATLRGALRSTHIIQLAAGIFESHSALVSNIASSSAFQANTESSNETQVRRILRDERLFLQSVYYPLIQQLFAEMQPNVLYLTIDESSHGSDFNIFSVNLISDATAIPLGWLLYATDDDWAEDARDLLSELAP